MNHIRKLIFFLNLFKNYVTAYLIKKIYFLFTFSVKRRNTKYLNIRELLLLRRSY